MESESIMCPTRPTYLLYMNISVSIPSSPYHNTDNAVPYMHPQVNLIKVKNVCVS